MITTRTPRYGLALVAMLVASSAAFAEELPLNLQVQLLSKMTSSIPQMQPAAATDPVKIVVVYPGDTVSRGAQSLVNAIKQVGKFGPNDTSIELMSSNDAAKIVARKPNVIYLASEVDEGGATAIVNAVGTGSAVTVSTVSDHPRLGIVIAFALQEARPRVLVNLKQARKQNIEFKNKFLTFAVIVDK